MATNTLVGQEFYADLIRHKLIIPSGVPGVFGRGAIFEDIVQRFDALVSRVTDCDGAERAFFPPVLDQRVLEKSGYLDAFPHLAGSVFSFQGTNAQHQELCARVHGGRPWSDLLVRTDVVLAPAACYSVYPTCAGMVPESGRLVDTYNWVFRHEPSPEPTRMQAFRMREVVRIGPPAVVVAWRDMWLTRGLELLRSLELAASAQVASDPFFGRGGRLLAASQRQQELKFEVMIPVISDDEPTAVCSFNYHQDHFGEIFDICTPDGHAAHSACLGFGMERVTMALLKTHGFVPTSWPAAVRERLGL
jgi:seryl-tRNA synthetase